MRRSARNPAAPVLLLALTLGALGCAGPPEIPEDLAWGATAAEESAPLGGEALRMRRLQMQRSHADLRHFHATLLSLRQRADRSGLIQLSGFLDAYIGLHLDPLLVGEWQSRHPELMALDANLRFAKAAVLIELREPSRVGRAVAELERRFEGRGTMLVEYPLGVQTPLAEALRLVREKKWRG